MVPDVEFQLEITALLTHAVNPVVLLLVQFDIGNRGKGFKGPVPHILPVGQGPDGHFRGLDEAQYPGLDHLAVKNGGLPAVGKQFFLWRIPAVFAPVGPAFGTVLLLDLLVHQLQRIPQGIRCGRDIDGETVVLAGHQHPGSPECSFHPVKFSLCFWFDEYMTALHTPGACRVGRRGKVQDHTVPVQHAPEPGTAVKSHGDLARFIHYHLHAPLPELVSRPFRCILIGIGPDEPATETVAEHIQVLHHPVIALTGLNDLFQDGTVLGKCREELNQECK